jgi:hypothetical protein
MWYEGCDGSTKSIWYEEMGQAVGNLRDHKYDILLEIGA